MGNQNTSGNADTVSGGSGGTGPRPRLILKIIGIVLIILGAFLLSDPFLKNAKSKSK